MDETGIEQKGLAPLAPLLARIDALSARAALPPLLADLHTVGVRRLLRVRLGARLEERQRVNIAGVWPGGLGLPDRDYYFRDDAAVGRLRKQYVEHVAAMLALAGAPPQAGRRRRRDAHRDGTRHGAPRRGHAARSGEDLPQDDAGELQALTPAFDWTRYLRAAGAPAIRAIQRDGAGLLEGLDQVVGVHAARRPQGVPQVARSAARRAAAVQGVRRTRTSRFYGKTLQGAQEQRPRWKRCVGYTDGDLGEALGTGVRERTPSDRRPRPTRWRWSQAIEARARAGHQHARLDDRRRRRSRRIAKLHAVVEQDRLSRPLARLLARSRIERGDALGNSPARQRVRVPAAR